MLRSEEGKPLLYPEDEADESSNSTRPSIMIQTSSLSITGLRILERRLTKQLSIKSFGSFREP
jgi:hypothetical protein